MAYGNGKKKKVVKKKRATQDPRSGAPRLKPKPKKK